MQVSAYVLLRPQELKGSVRLALVVEASVLGGYETETVNMLATAIWALTSYGRRTRADQERGSSPEELLAERYARGDITTEEYQERLATLRE
jgi:putative membrane protein